MIKHGIVVCFVAILLVGCSASSKLSYSEDELGAFRALVESGDFEIVSDWAFPLASNSLNSIANAGLLPIASNLGRISLVGNVNYLKIKGDSTQAYLPYFGERQFAGTYGTDNTGIVFETVPDDLNILFNAKKKQADIKFSARNSTEVFDVAVVIYPNLQSSINITSNQRRTISYQGVAKTNNE